MPELDLKVGAKEQFFLPVLQASSLAHVPAAAQTKGLYKHYMGFFIPHSLTSSTKMVDSSLVFYLHGECLANPHKMRPVNITEHFEPCRESFPSKPCVLLLMLPESLESLSKPTENTSLSCQCFSVCRRKDSLVAHRDLAVSMCAFYSWWSPTSPVTLGELTNFSTHQNVCLLYNITYFLLMEIPLEKFIAWHGWEAV